MLIKAFEAFDLDLMAVAHEFKGINSYVRSSKIDEIDFVQRFVRMRFKNKKTVIFDVGANIGLYTRLIKESLPYASIYSFEPNPFSYKVLVKNTQGYHGVTPLMLGLGQKETKELIYSYFDEPGSEHACLFKSVITDLHRAENVFSEEILISALDTFCKKHSIEYIDFLKIDTEGYELEVLKGAKTMIQNKLIGMIQFEFNEMNVFSRVFLKDFYDILPGYEFFRLSHQGLLPLGKYDTINEIFKYQNFIAIAC